MCDYYGSGRLGKYSTNPWYYVFTCAVRDTTMYRLCQSLGKRPVKEFHGSGGLTYSNRVASLYVRLSLEKRLINIWFCGFIYCMYDTNAQWPVMFRMHFNELWQFYCSLCLILIRHIYFRMCAFQDMSFQDILRSRLCPFLGAFVLGYSFAGFILSRICSSQDFFTLGFVRSRVCPFLSFQDISQQVNSFQSVCFRFPTVPPSSWSRIFTTITF